METSIVTIKGQIVIPKKIRNLLHIKKGTRICFEPRDGEIVLKPLTPEYFDKMAGALGTEGKVLKAFLKNKKREHNTIEGC